MKKMYKTIVAALLVGILAGPYAWMDSKAATTGSGFTDILPPNGAGNTTVISNGTGYNLTTLAPSQTFGDALSRAPFTGYQSTSTLAIGATTAVTTMTATGAGAGFVGSSTFPVTWVALGRSIRFTARGQYTTLNNQNSWTWGLKIGTTTVVSSSVPAPTNVASSGCFTANGILTVTGTGTSGTMLASYDIFATTGTQATVGTTANVSNVISYSTCTASTVTIDLTNPLQMSVNPTFNWGQASQGNTLTITNSFIEFIN